GTRWYSAGVPALSRAVKRQKWVARVGFDWTNSDDVSAHFDSQIQQLLPKY
ncbi:MAG: hypothetical protein ACI9WS_003234, partial [Paraglaciecola psychrophila]